MFFVLMVNAEYKITTYHYEEKLSS
jgi:hypothetical protein